MDIQHSWHTLHSILLFILLVNIEEWIWIRVLNILHYSTLLSMTTLCNSLQNVLKHLREFWNICNSVIHSQVLPSWYLIVQHFKLLWTTSISRLILFKLRNYQNRYSRNFDSTWYYICIYRNDTKSLFSNQFLSRFHVVGNFENPEFQFSKIGFRQNPTQNLVTEQVLNKVYTCHTAYTPTMKIVRNSGPEMGIFQMPVQRASEHTCVRAFQR